MKNVSKTIDSEQQVKQDIISYSNCIYFTATISPPRGMKSMQSEWRLGE